MLQVLWGLVWCSSHGHSGTQAEGGTTISWNIQHFQLLKCVCGEEECALSFKKGGIRVTWGWHRHLCEWQTHFPPYMSHGQSYHPGLMTCGSRLLLSRGESIMHFLLLTLCSLMSCWELEISHGGSIYTTEMGKCPKLGLSFFKEQFINTPLTWPFLNENVFKNVEWKMNAWRVLLSFRP